MYLEADCLVPTVLLGVIVSPRMPVRAGCGALLGTRTYCSDSKASDSKLLENESKVHENESNELKRKKSIWKRA